MREGYLVVSSFFKKLFQLDNSNYEQQPPHAIKCIGIQCTIFIKIFIQTGCVFVVIENLRRANRRFTSTAIKGLRAVHLPTYYVQYFQILSAYTHTTSVCLCVWNIDANRSHILESVRPLTQKTKFPHNTHTHIYTHRNRLTHIDRNLQYTRGVYLLCLTASTEIRALSAMLRLVKAAVL